MGVARLGQSGGGPVDVAADRLIVEPHPGELVEPIRGDVEGPGGRGQAGQAFGLRAEEAVDADAGIGRIGRHAAPRTSPRAAKQLDAAGGGHRGPRRLILDEPRAAAGTDAAGAPFCSAGAD